MQEAGASQPLLAGFLRQVAALRAGATGLIPDAAIRPPTRLADFQSLPAGAPAEAALDQTVLIKLNGGLGTSMGLDCAKSLLVARAPLTFLEIIARHALYLREHHRARLPVLFMDSFRTQEDTRAALAALPELAAGQGDLPLSFLQNRVPKLLESTLTPAHWPKDDSLTWCPPGHGDLYTALTASGILQRLLNHGFRYAFVSNADNLGATLDLRILAFFTTSGAPFLMEVTDRTPADRKGGHLAESMEGRLLLRERAQCPETELASFEDVTRFRSFNTNNLWIDLRAVAELLDRSGGPLDLPLIVNRKTLDPADPTSPRVIQLETAMGAAISLFPQAMALRVPRSRFSPVKATEDLLAIRSDAYELTEDYRITLRTGRPPTPPVVQLDPRFFRNLADFEARFPAGPPAMRHCSRFRVEGDIVFGPGVVLEGDVFLRRGGPPSVTVRHRTFRGIGSALNL